jgi:hypothetical protein
MGRPRKLSQPVKINLILEKETKDSAKLIALERKISVSRLFESLLFKEIAERLTKKSFSTNDKKTPEVSLACGDNASGVNGHAHPVDPNQHALQINTDQSEQALRERRPDVRAGIVG